MYPLALAQQSMPIHQELELALLQSVHALLSQAVKLLNYFRLHRGITLSPEQLASLRSMLQYSSSIQKSNVIQTPLNVDVTSMTDEEEVEDAEESPRKCYDPNENLKLNF
jgi:hypothetical protein